MADIKVGKKDSFLFGKSKSGNYLLRKGGKVAVLAPHQWGALLTGAVQEYVFTEVAGQNILEIKSVTEGAGVEGVTFQDFL